MCATWDPNILNELVSCLHDNRLILFTGAGISARFGYPCWSDLGRIVIEACIADAPLIETKNKLRSMQKNYEPLKSLDFLMRHYPISSPKIISSQFRLDPIKIDKKAYEQKFLVDFLNLGFRGYLTTNVDTSLSYLTGKNREGTPSVFSCPTRPPQVEELDKSDCFVVYLHGNIHDSNTMAFTKKQYGQIYSQQFETLLKKLVDRYRFLFVGISFRDAYLEHVLHKSLKNTRCYAILPEDNPDYREVEESDFSDNLNTTPIFYKKQNGPENEHQGFEDLIRQFVNASQLPDISEATFGT